jgi:hypothetical protein
MANIQIKKLLGGVTTAAVLSYAYLGFCDIVMPEENHKFIEECNLLPEGYSNNQYYTLIEGENRTKDQVEIIHKFVSALVENTQDLNPDFSKTVDSHFWDLI